MSLAGLGVVEEDGTFTLDDVPEDREVELLIEADGEAATRVRVPARATDAGTIRVGRAP